MLVSPTKGCRCMCKSVRSCPISVHNRRPKMSLATELLVLKFSCPNRLIFNSISLLFNHKNVMSTNMHCGFLPLPSFGVHLKQKMTTYTNL